MDEVREVTGMKLAELKDVTTEMKKWRWLAMMVARPCSIFHYYFEFDFRLFDCAFILLRKTI